ncbi:hypothetical protein CMEL01_12483 [Colletotrichum melonis]|uniref:Uncharacterized protein n=3 Tax=Colletotrichum acutatum species complex TaxID=2707335 RepID=A0AAJ0E199_9PEZI|nr:uncharacterized protein CCOS01_07305 [Colletotrichum costaricense]KAI3541441.1 hypothetical protein CSPX01_07529 [Colletotrichum filicis]KAK0375377.1 hypothetical protein CLIM01_07276 [Colletotrichum limetticola]KAK1465128.1 hypothetical protein CMEL01_12483 [Colletotrichum melonis]KAK1702969.1 hypothetical protein BDP67DRAFT_584954 [Colletotrichum lupini]KAK1527043.1 hypothetical protein CCOS01_07305 [Colletotrichum costaricense]
MPQYQPQADTFKDPSSKAEAKQQMAEQQYEERKEHSKSGANTQTGHHAKIVKEPKQD